MQCHPFLPVIAVSGIDESVKIFAPVTSGTQKFSHLANAETITNRNNDPHTEGSLSVSGVSLHSFLISLSLTDLIIQPNARLLMAFIEQRILTEQENEDDSDTEGSGLRPRRIIRFQADDNNDCTIM